MKTYGIEELLSDQTVTPANWRCFARFSSARNVSVSCRAKYRIFWVSGFVILIISFAINILPSDLSVVIPGACSESCASLVFCWVLRECCSYWWKR